MASGSLKDAAKLIKSAVTTNPTPRSLPQDTQKAIDAFLGKYKPIDDHDSQRLQEELLSIHSLHVAKDTDKASVFLHALQLLRPAITGQARLEEWWRIAVAPVVNAIGRRKDEVEHATGFIYAVLDYSEDEKDAKRAKESEQFARILIDAYLQRTKISVEDTEAKTLENEYIARQLEHTLITFGRKKPKNLLLAIDRVVVERQHRMQALGLLSAFVRHQPPHLHLVSETPLIEHILKCLLIDTSTTVVSLALTTLIMFLPHIPSSVMTHLPRLFLIYSRLLCWERYSPSATSEAKQSVQDEDKQSKDDDTEREPEDESWEKLTSSFDGAESTAPELIHYFTFLYGLYPLNFTSYIRKPRKYLKTIDFPRADDFDLDQHVIRTRTEQFRRQHLLHPNFYNTTIEDELKDNRWLKSDPAEVVAECVGLSLAIPSTYHNRLGPLEPSPTVRLPDIPGSQVRTDDIPTENLQIHTNGDETPKSVDFRDPASVSRITVDRSYDLNGDSPTLPPVLEKPASPTSHLHSSTTSVPSGAASSPTLDHFPMPTSAKSISLRSPALRPVPASESSIAFLKREVLLLRNDLHFERYLKQQHLSHIGALQNQQIKDATVEVETQNLINSNRALKAKLAKADETNTSLKREIATGRNQSKKFETELSTRVRSLRSDEKQWRADEEAFKLEVQKLTRNSDHLRRLVVESEARELLSQQKLTSMQLELEQIESLRTRVQELEEKLRAYEEKELQFERATNDADALRTELSTVNLRLESRDAGIEWQKHAYDRRIAELESKIQFAQSPETNGGTPSSPMSPKVQVLIDNAVASVNTKYSNLKKEYAALRHRFVEMELKCQDLREELADANGLEGSGLAISIPHGQPSLARSVSSGVEAIPPTRIVDTTTYASTDIGSAHEEDVIPSVSEKNDLQDLDQFLPVETPLTSSIDSPATNNTPVIPSPSTGFNLNTSNSPTRPENIPNLDADIFRDDELDENNSFGGNGKSTVFPNHSVPGNIRHVPAKAAKMLGEPSLMLGNGDSSTAGVRWDDSGSQIYQRSESAFSAESLDGEKSKGMFGWKRGKSGSGSVKEKDKEAGQASQRSKGGSWFRGL